MAISQAKEPLEKLRADHKHALDEVERHNERAAAQDVISADEQCDAAARNLASAIAARNAAVRKYSEIAQAVPGYAETARRLATSNAIDVATAFHRLPHAPGHIPSSALKPLAEFDAELLGLKGG
jgi:hypothetical protein